MTKHQIDLMTEKTIIPVNVLELCVDDDEVFQRATQDRRSPSRYKNYTKLNWEVTETVRSLHFIILRFLIEHIQYMTVTQLFLYVWLVGRGRWKLYENGIRMFRETGLVLMERDLSG